MKATARILKYWEAIKGHKGFYYPSESATDLPIECIVHGEVMPWLAPSNMLCLKAETNRLIFVLKENVIKRG